MALKIGLFTSGKNEKTYDLIKTIKNSFPDISIPFLFLDLPKEKRGQWSDLGIEIIQFSSEEFSQKSASENWQEEYYQRVMQQISSRPIDLALFIDYELTPSTQFIENFTVIKFRPTLPDGPSGDPSTILWQLIGTRALESGATMHLLTAQDPERGIPLAFCNYSIKDKNFFQGWRIFDLKMKTFSMKQIMETEGENNELFQAIKEKTEVWEWPFVNLVIEYLSSGVISIQENKIYLEEELQKEGCCLTEEIKKIYFEEEVTEEEEKEEVKEEEEPEEEKKEEIDIEET